MPERSRKGPSQALPRTATPAEGSRREPSSSPREKADLGRSSPPLGPIHAEPPIAMADPKPDAVKRETSAFSQILHDLIRTLPRPPSGPTVAETTPPLDHVAAAIPPTPEGRPSTGHDTRASADGTSRDEVDRQPAQAPVRMQAEIQGGHPTAIAAQPRPDGQTGLPESRPVNMPGANHALTAIRSAAPDVGSASLHSPEGGSTPQNGRVLNDHAVATEAAVGPRSTLAAPGPLNPSDRGAGTRTPATIAVDGGGSPKITPPLGGDPLGVMTSSALRLRHAEDAGSSAIPTSTQGKADPFQDPSTSRTSASAFDEARGLSDSGRTNTLLEQILDELRKSRQPSFVASGRSAYPER